MKGRLVVKKFMNWKLALAVCGAVLVFGAGVATGASKFNKPKSVIHLVQVKWKAGATDAQKKAAIDGVEKMAAQTPGIKNIWMKQTRAQFWGDPRPDAAWVIEFENREAERAYEKSDARKEWFEKVYDPIRDESRSSQWTNE
jgi:hypothetical protein